MLLFREAYVFQSSADDASVALGIRLSERKERELVAFYRDLRQLNKQYFQDSEFIELSVLKDGEHLYYAVKRKI